MCFLQQSDYPRVRVPALWHPPPSPENEIARDLLRILAHVAANECRVAGRSLKSWFIGGVRRRDTFRRADRLTDIRAG